MKVLMITPEVDLHHDSRGFIHTWVDALAKRVDKLSVIALRVGTTRLPANVEIMSLRHEGRRVPTLCRFLTAVHRSIKHEKPDIIFTHMIPVFAILASPLAKLHGIPVVLWYTHGTVQWRLRLAHRLVDRVVTASLDSFRIDSPKRIVLCHGIDTDYFVPASDIPSKSLGDERVRLLTISRLSPSKDILTVINALSGMSEQLRGKFVYNIIGAPFSGSASDRQYEDRLKHLVSEADLSSQVTFHGAIPHNEILPMLQRCDIFVHPSLTGSIDKAALEAMSCAKPVVTCNSSFVEMLAPIDGSLLFPPHDNRALAESLIHLASLGRLRLSAIGFSLRQIVSHNHNLSTLFDRLVALFNDLSSARISRR